MSKRENKEARIAQLKLTEKQIKAAEVLASGGSQKDAAEAVSVNESTISRWVRDANFCRFRASLAGSGDEKPPQLTELATPSEFASHMERELKISERSFDIAEKFLDVSDSIVTHLKSEKPEELSPRLLASIVRSSRDLIEMGRESHDRATGLEALLNEVYEIRKVAGSQNIISIDSANSANSDSKKITRATTS